jgi:hypothetical protein
MIIYLPLLVCIVGLLIYALVVNNGKVTEIGRTMFWTGLLVTIFQCANSTIVVLHK